MGVHVANMATWRILWYGPNSHWYSLSVLMIRICYDIIIIQWAYFLASADELQGQVDGRYSFWWCWYVAYHWWQRSSSFCPLPIRHMYVWHRWSPWFDLFSFMRGAGAEGVDPDVLTLCIGRTHVRTYVCMCLLPSRIHQTFRKVSGVNMMTIILSHWKSWTCSGRLWNTAQSEKCETNMRE